MIGVCSATVEVFEWHCGGLSYLPVSNDAVVSAESVLSGGLQPLHVLKAFNPPSQLAEPRMRNGRMSPCDAFHFLFALPGFPSARLAQ